MRSFELRGLTASPRSWTQTLLLIGVCLCVGSANASDTFQEVRVRRFAAFVEAPLAESRDGAARTRIQGVGRAMTLVLKDNTTVAATVPGVQLQRGMVEDIPGSWVRLTRSNAGVDGLIWDGQELYVVTPSGGLTQAAATRGNVIYKLSEARTGLPATYCGTAAADTTERTGMQQYQALQQELSNYPPPTDSPTTTTLRLELQLLADALYRAQFSSDDEAKAALLTRINNVDGIFSSQLGLAVQATDVTLLDEQLSAQLTSTDAGGLLSSLATLRNSSSVMMSYPVTHLITGRDLNGDTLGISYIGQMCGAKYAVSLSESRTRGAWIDSLVMAHELGHQLGAVHDGTGMCAETDPNQYLMSANISGTSELSACSEQVMQHTMSHSACLVPSSLPTVLPTASNTSAASNESSGGGALTTSLLTLLGLLALARRWQSMSELMKQRSLN